MKIFGFDNLVDTLWKKFFSWKDQETALFTKLQLGNT
jgi:hypothetical protein